MPTSITCQRCQSVNEPYATTCQNCGARFCPTCKLVIDSPSARVCPHCGKTDLTFKPGKYTGSTYVPPGVASTSGPAQTYCSNCGSRIEPGARKCPYCGRLGQVVTQTPVQGFGVMKPAHGDREPEPMITTQKVCSKCGTPIPPGSSLCPVHGKFGGGNVLRQKVAPNDMSVEAEAYRRMAARGSGATEPSRAQTRHTPPEDIYPQMMPTTGSLGTAQPEEVHEQRICPVCRSLVPPRSKICPTCGNERVPAERARPMLRAEEFHKAREATAQSHQAAYMPPPDQFYGQPEVQPYEAAFPVPSPGFVEPIQPRERARKEKKPKEVDYSRAGHQRKKFPWSMLLALLALVGVGIVGVTLLSDMLKGPATPALPPPAASSPSATVAPAADIQISSIAYKDIGKTSATVTWTTNKKSNSVVIYCLDGGTQCENAKDDTLTTTHAVKLSNLEQGKSYHITVKSMAGDTDVSKDATEVLKTSVAADTTPPKISGMKVVNLTSAGSGASATITWTTDEPATSQVSYGTSNTYGTLQPEQTETTLVTDHSVELYGLPAGQTIHYKILTRDAAGNQSSSSDATFTTPSTTTSTGAGLGIGSSAPDFTLDCADGESISLSSLKGKKVILNFWSPNCPYCLEEMPFLQQVQDDKPEVVMLAICGPQVGAVSGNEAQIGGYLTSNNITFKVPLDPTGSVAQTYSVTQGVPVTFFIDANGIIKGFQNGAFMNGPSQILAKLNSY